MFFNSFSFIFLFLPISLVVFFALGRINRQWASAWLALASLFFYGFWNIRVLPLLLFSVLVNFQIGAKISGSLDEYRFRSFIFLVLGLGFNLGLLFFFKYGDFFVTNANVVLKLLHWGQMGYLGIGLPVGISFYTFTQIAYLVDCHQGKVWERNWMHYLLFVSYFPHLIAGPILHHGQMIPQFRSERTYRPHRLKIAIGLVIFTIGLGKKLLVADHLAPYTDLLFQNVKLGLHPQLFLSWTGVLAYTGQIYFDFSGYTDMAIGISLLFGIRLPANFNSPYQATSIIDFWRRWHMTLSAFLKDYLYIPLGGNRQGRVRQYFNLMITMFLGGLWHGANWTFVLWGVLHGLFLSCNHAWERMKGERIRDNVFTRTGAWLLTMICVCFSWALFRSDNLTCARSIYRGLLGLNGISLPEGLAGKVPFSPIFQFHGLWQGAWHPYGLDPQGYLIFLSLAGILCLCFKNSGTLIPDFEMNRNWSCLALRPWAAVGLGGVFTLCLFSLNRFSQFLYFQF